MNTRLSRMFCALLILAGCGSLCVAQNQGPPDAPVQSVLLLSAIKHQDDNRGALFNFEHGLRNDSPVKPPGQRYDIRYGGISENGDDAWIELASKRGSHSMMQDLGPAAWSELHNTPIVFASPNPHTGMIEHSFAHGRPVRVGPEGVVVKAVAGHMYVLHVKDGGADYYTVFRVESVDRERGVCRLTWKLVQSPEG